MNVTVNLHVHPAQVGVTSAIEAAMRFVRWADAKGERLTWQDVQDFLGCSRATAHRWFNAYNAARGRQ